MSDEGRVNSNVIDYYSVLGVPRTATQSQIEEASHRLSEKYRPDLGFNDSTLKNEFDLIQVAYESLSNPTRRLAYDFSTEPMPERIELSPPIAPPSTSTPTTLPPSRRAFPDAYERIYPMPTWGRWGLWLLGTIALVAYIGFSLERPGAKGIALLFMTCAPVTAILIWQLTWGFHDRFRSGWTRAWVAISILGAFAGLPFATLLMELLVAYVGVPITGTEKLVALLKIWVPLSVMNAASWAVIIQVIAWVTRGSWK